MTGLAAIGDAPFQPLHPMRYWGYQLWSGIGSDLQELALVVAIITAAIAVYRFAHRHLECHAESCRRLGLHHVAGTAHRTCWEHHPVLSEHPRHGVPVHLIHARHKESQ